MGKGIDFGAYKSKFEELAADVAKLGAPLERSGTMGFERAVNSGSGECERSARSGAAGGALAVFAAAVALVVIGTLILLTVWLT